MGQHWYTADRTWPGRAQWKLRPGQWQDRSKLWLNQDQKETHTTQDNIMLTKNANNETDKQTNKQRHTGDRSIDERPRHEDRGLSFLPTFEYLFRVFTFGIIFMKTNKETVDS